MRAGRLRASGTFQRQVTTRDAAGQALDVWEDIDDARVEIEPISGREYFNASGERAVITHRIRTRYKFSLATLKPRDRLVSNGRVFNLHSVLNHRERKREFEIMAEEVV